MKSGQRRTAEYDDNFSDPINTLQSSGEILNWISSNVDQNNTFSICVSRNDIFNRGMQQWQRQKKSSPKGRLKVTFFGESGVDSGALSKEFLTEMIAEIETRLFIDGVDKKGKNPVYCLNSLDRNYFRSAGEIMAVSLAQGGPPPVFLREWCFQYLCSGDYDSIQVTTSDVTDLEFSLLIEKVNSTDDMSELTDEILSCGYTGKVSADMKSNIIRAIVLHSTMRVVPVLDQLRKGLQLCDLPKVMEMHPDLCLPLFVPGENDDRVNHCGPYGVIYFHQKDFNITVKFNHDCDTNHTVCFPTVSACTRTITFPTAHLKTLNEFKNIMGIAMKYGESFDNVYMYLMGKAC